MSSHSGRKIKQETPFDAIGVYLQSPYSLENDVGEECFKLLAEGGVVVMCFSPPASTENPIAPIRVISSWVDFVGFGLFEGLIYKEEAESSPLFHLRRDSHFIPIFVKGRRSNFFSKEHVKIPCKHAGKSMKGGANRNKDGKTVKSRTMKINPTKCPGTVWEDQKGMFSMVSNLLMCFTKPGDNIMLHSIKEEQCYIEGRNVFYRML